MAPAVVIGFIDLDTKDYIFVKPQKYWMHTYYFTRHSKVVDDNKMLILK